MKRAKCLICALLLAILTSCAVGALAYTTGDDYPWKNGPMEGWDDYMFVKRNCTSFVAWCLNSRNGVAFHNTYYGVDWGWAGNWGYAAQSVGIPVDDQPAIGSVAWMSSGHVAWVREVNGENVTVDEYNWGDDGVYHSYTWPKSHYTGFIHIADIGGTVTVDRGQDGVYLCGEDVRMSVSDSPYSYHILKVYYTPVGASGDGYPLLAFEGQVDREYTMKFNGAGYYSCTFWGNGYGPTGWVGWRVVDPSTKLTLDVNGVMDGTPDGTTVGMGTFDVYIAGERVADDVTDYCGRWPARTEYEIRDIRPVDGKSYIGISSGTRSGLIDRDVKTVNLSFRTAPQSPGNPSATGTWNGHTYQYYASEAFSWYEAKALSEGLGGHLVTIGSAAENDYVFELCGHSAVWIGLSDQGGEGNWAWVTGEPLTYANWYPGQPDRFSGNDEGGEFYAQHTGAKTGQWNDNSGFRTCGFVCEIEPEASSTARPFAVNGILDNAISDSLEGWATFDVYMNGTLVADDVSAYSEAWSATTEYEIRDIRPADGKSFVGIHEGPRKGRINRTPMAVSLAFKTVAKRPTGEPTVGTWGGHTYYFYPVACSWYEAKRFSENLGGHLVTLGSAEEDAYVFGLAGQSSVWIGLADQDGDGIWTWVTGESPSYANWYPGQPDRSGGSDEGDERFAQYSSAKNGQWNDNASFNAGGFVCEIESGGKHLLAVDGLLDGISADHIAGWGTFDVYVDGVFVADDVCEYSDYWPAQTQYEIRDIRPLDGKSFFGISAGQRAGTTGGKPTTVRLSFTSVPQTPGADPTVGTWGGHTYYYYAPESYTWYEAMTLSERLGGHLVTINSAEEDAFVFNFVGKTHVWIGLSDQRDVDNWTWVTGEPVTYTNWYPGQPDKSTGSDEGTERFAQYVYSTSGQWNDNAGCAHNGFVCEMESVFTAVFDGNGGGGSMDSLKALDGMSVELPDCAFTAPEGMLFRAWEIDGAEYAPGAAYVMTGDVAVVALWEEIFVEPDAALPDDLTEIGEEAFAGSAFTAVRIPEHTRIVGKRAFADCLGLRHVYVPDGIESIAQDAFEGVPEGLVLHGESGGYAQYYAKQYGFAFRAE